MDAGGEQALVHVNVSQARDKRLIEQQRLDGSLTPREFLRERCFADREHIRPQPFERPVPREPSELSDVLVEQRPPLERDDASRVFIGFRVESKNPGHTQAGD
jgi:hypothetical protein